MFSESSYYVAFKKVRNKFRKYRSYELIGRALKYINAPYKDKIESLRRQPWLVLLFIKWVLLDDNYPNARGEVASNSDIHLILQSSYELSSKIRMPSEYEHHILFFRNMAFQQFLYQRDFYYAHLSRQSILFTDLDKNHFISKEFKKKTGIEIQEFLDLSLITLIRFLDSNEAFLPDNWFSNIYSSYPANKVESFLASISKDINEIRKDLISKDNRKRLSSELYELTPFIEYPLIKIPGKYILTHRNILFRRFEYFVYDTMRSIDSAKFMDKFGELFERYVERSIQYSELNYLTEKDIENTLGAAGNQIDFIIQDSSANIFVDAKAVEMNSQGKTTHLSNLVRDKTKNSILKAIKQSHDVIRKISDRDNCAITGSKNNYLLVVTFKELYIGSGSTYYDVIAKEKMDEIYNEYKEHPCIPPENMYFITIDDFDILTSIIREEELTLSEIIDIAKKKDKDPHTRKFDFHLHLRALGVEPKTSEYLALEKDKMFDRILEAADD